MVRKNGGVFTKYGVGGVALKPLKDPMRDPSDEEILLALSFRGVPTMARTLMFDMSLDYRHPLKKPGRAVKRVKSLLTAGTVEKVTPTTYRLTEKGVAALQKHLRDTTGPLTAAPAMIEEELTQIVFGYGNFSDDGSRTMERCENIARGLLKDYNLTPR